MQRFKLEQSNADMVSHAGLALVGQAIKKQTRLSQELDMRVPLRHGIKHSDVLKSYLALLSTGKNNFEDAMDRAKWINRVKIAEAP